MNAFAALDNDAIAAVTPQQALHQLLHLRARSPSQPITNDEKSAKA